MTDTHPLNLNRIISCAAGREKADLVLVNGRVINVFSGEILSETVAIADGYILGTGDYPARKIIDLEGRFIAPGFIDPHLHIESSMASVTEFVRAVLPCGTTTVAADPHEIANVLGGEGIAWMLESAQNQPMNVYYTLPSCVPATDMETAGACLKAADLARFMGEDRVLGLAEVMNYPGVIHQDPGLLEKIILAKTRKKRVEGHSPALTGKNLNAYLCAGISSDHECFSLAEAVEKLRAGMYVMVREGTCAQNLNDLFPLISDKTFHRMMWCTDDLHAHDILEQGHVDHIVRRAIDLGLDPVMAIQMATIVPARYYGLRDVGAIGPGRRADLVVFSDLNTPRIEQVYTGGELRAENGQMLPDVPRRISPSLPRAMNLDPGKVDFSIPAESPRVRVIELIPGQILTRERIMEASVSGSLAEADPSRGLIKLAVVERYTGNAKTGKGFLTGLGLKHGALAGSVAHDSHNIIVAGASDASMKTALAAVVRMGGGLAAAADGKVLAQLPLPIAGLMSHEPMSVIREKLDALIRAAHELGAAVQDPFMILSFLALPVIPDLKLTDRGLVDVRRFEIVPLFV
jgi:adenine deaminase